jgi:hypothetical protein
MPTIAIIAGVKILVYYNDHLPPHFHADFAEFKSQISMLNGQLIEGKLPPSKLAIIEQWTIEHKKELLECWKKAQNHENPGKVG